MAARTVHVRINVEWSSLRPAFEKLARMLLGEPWAARGERYCGIETHDELTGRCFGCGAER